MQSLLGRGHWDAEALRDEVRAYVIAALAIRPACSSSMRRGTEERRAFGWGGATIFRHGGTHRELSARRVLFLCEPVRACLHRPATLFAAWQEIEAGRARSRRRVERRSISADVSISRSPLRRGLRTRPAAADLHDDAESGPKADNVRQTRHSSVVPRYGRLSDRSRERGCPSRQCPGSAGLSGEMTIGLGFREWLAGAGGFEPPHGGIKIRCLTAWRRPNAALSGCRSRPAGP